MSSEQKVILGIVSIRQLIYVVIGGTIIYNLANFWFHIIFDWRVAAAISLITSIPFVAVFGLLGFLKKGNYHMYYDHYLLVRLSRKGQYGKWIK